MKKLIAFLILFFITAANTFAAADTIQGKIDKPKTEEHQPHETPENYSKA